MPPSRTRNTSNASNRSESMESEIRRPHVAYSPSPTIPDATNIPDWTQIEFQSSRNYDFSSVAGESTRNTTYTSTPSSVHSSSGPSRTASSLSYSSMGSSYPTTPSSESYGVPSPYTTSSFLYASSSTAPYEYPPTSPHPNPPSTDADPTEVPTHTPFLTPSLTRTRKRANPDHPRRPQNPFIVFRIEYCRRYTASGGKKHQTEVSKDAAALWNAMTKDEQRVFQEESRIRRAQHALAFPNFHYDMNVKNKITPSDKEPTRGADSTLKGRSKKTTKLPRKRNRKGKKGIKAGQDGRTKVSAETREGYNVFRMEFGAPLPIAPNPQSSEFQSPSLSQSQSQPDAPAILGWEDSRPFSQPYHSQDMHHRQSNGIGVGGSMYPPYHQQPFQPFQQYQHIQGPNFATGRQAIGHSYLNHQAPQFPAVNLTSPSHPHFNRFAMARIVPPTPNVIKTPIHSLPKELEYNDFGSLNHLSDQFISISNSTSASAPALASTSYHPHSDAIMQTVGTSPPTPPFPFTDIGTTTPTATTQHALAQMVPGYYTYDNMNNSNAGPSNDGGSTRFIVNDRYIPPTVRRARKPPGAGPHPHPHPSGSSSRSVQLEHEHSAFGGWGRNGWS